MTTTAVRCQVCGRPLRTARARERGTGPKCEAKLRARADQQPTEQLTVGAP